MNPYQKPDPCPECLCVSVPPDDGPCRYCFHSVEFTNPNELFFPANPEK
jgi:hypothetical protein